MAHQLDGFSKLSRVERIEMLGKLGLLSKEDVTSLLSGENPPIDLAEHLIENVIGYFHVPLGVAPHFKVDGREYVVPFAVEETSIVAAASNTAKWVKNCGEITTEMIGTEIIGQIQMAKVSNPGEVCERILSRKDELLSQANAIVPSLVNRGGGVRGLDVRVLDRNPGEIEKMVVVHLRAEVGDAMGANLINQICEGLREKVATIAGVKVNMCILSNLVDTKLTRARVRIREIDPALGHGIEEASLFAQKDPYRAATNNKGVLNGIDAVALATGNDWRAIEAGVHAYAARDGQYRSITSWKMDGNDLVGELTAPIIVGTVGGVTRLHPMARTSLRILKTESSAELSRVMAAVGLIQNLGALKALSTVGIVEGHMKLHAANLALAAGAAHTELSEMKSRLEEILKRDRRVSLSTALETLENLRREKTGEVARVEGVEDVQPLSPQ